MQRFIIIPPDSLKYSTLESLLITILTRQGYDTSNTDDAGIKGEAASLVKKLKRKELFLVQDLETQLSEVLTAEDVKKFTS